MGRKVKSLKAVACAPVPGGAPGRRCVYLTDNLSTGLIIGGYHGHPDLFLSHIRKQRRSSRLQGQVRGYWRSLSDIWQRRSTTARASVSGARAGMAASGRILCRRRISGYAGTVCDRIRRAFRKKGLWQQCTEAGDHTGGAQNDMIFLIVCSEELRISGA